MLEEQERQARGQRGLTARVTPEGAIGISPVLTISGPGAILALA